MKKLFISILSIFMLVTTLIGLSACGTEKIEFRVNFIADGEIVYVLNTNGNETIKMPTNPEKAGCTFDGWFWDKNVWEKPFTANSLLDAPLSSDMSVYAKFTEIHTHNYTPEIIEPTCTEQGYTIHRCACGDEYIDSYANALNHDFNNYVSNNDATCTQDGTKTSKCSHCEATDTIIDMGSKLGHDYDAPTYAWNEQQCTATRVCKHDSSHKETETVTATYLKDTGATCLTPEKGHYKAAFTNSAFAEQNTTANSVENGTALNHDFNNYISNNNATCTKDGTKTSKCSRCEVTDTITEVGSKLGHDYDTPTYVWNGQNCTAERVCMHDSSHKETETVIAAYIKDINATCLTPEKGHYKAMFTNPAFVEQNTAKESVNSGSPLGHNFEWVVDKPTSKTEAGLKHEKCTRCEETRNNNTIIPIITCYHENVQKVEGKAPTCTEKGVKDYWYCPECQKYFSDSSCQIEIAIDIDSWKVISETGHNYGVASYVWNGQNCTATRVCQHDSNHNETETVTASYVKDADATCLICEKGHYKAVFANFAFSEQNSTANSVDKGNPLGHSFTNYISDNNATCTEDGTKTAKCNRCSETSTITDVGSKSGHIYSTEWTSDDSYHWQTCSGCDEIQNKAVHSYDSDYTCTICGFSLQTTEDLAYKLSGDKSYYILTGIGYSIDTKIIVPAYINDKEVKEISSSAFKNNMTIQSIYLPATITIINDSAFENCSALEEVVIFEGLKKVGNRAFYNCDKLKGIVLPVTTENIGTYCFYDCDALLKVEIKSSKSNISAYCFENCDILQEVVLKDGISSIGNRAFYGCKKLSNIILPKTIISIGEYCFYNCSSLETINLDNENLAISKYVFENCTGLKTLDISKVSVNQSIIKGCSSLTSLKIKSLDSYVSILFGGTSYSNNSSSVPQSLKEIIIAEGSINEKAFYNCSNIEKVELLNVNKVLNSAFEGCTKMNSITLNSGISSIGKAAFSNTALYNDNSNWTKGILIVDNYIIGARTTIIGTYNIPDNIELIADYAFNNCENLLEINFGKSVKYIGSHSFENCNQLETIDLPKSVTAIGDYAFNKCSQLSNVYFSNEMIQINIGQNGFTNCSSLFNIYFDGTIDEWMAFCSSNYENSPMSIYEYRLYINGKLLDSIVFEESINIPNNSFANCISIRNITLHPSNLFSVQTFMNCRNIENFVFDGTFEEWCSLNVDYTYSPMRYSNNFTYDGDIVKEISLDGNLSNIKPYLYSNIGTLEKVSISNNATGQIASNVFNGCKVKTLEIPSSYISSFDLTYIENLSITKGTLASGSLSSAMNLKELTLSSINMSFGKYFASKTGAFVSSSSSPSFDIISEPDGMYIIYAGDEYYSRVQTGSHTIGGIYIDGRPAVSYSYNYYYYGYELPKSLKTVKILSGDIPEKAFYNCAFIENIVINESTKSIGANAFFNCKKIDSINIPNTVTTIGYNAFKNCESLSAFTIPEKITTINSSTFENCKSITSIIIPRSITSIGSNAFYNCTKLSVVCDLSGLGITCGSSENGYVGFYAAVICNDINDVRREERDEFVFIYTNTTSYLIDYCGDKLNVQLPTFDNGTYIIAKNAFNGKTFTSITIPNCVDTIKQYAFANCTNLTSIYIPDSVSVIETSAFNGCSNLESISLPYIGGSISDSNTFGYIFGTSEYSGGVKTAQSSGTYYLPAKLKEVEIRNGTIKANSFKNCTKIEKINLPSDASSIGNSAFYGCSNLLPIEISDKITSIGTYAFDGCLKFESFTVPNTVQTIGSGAFYGCTNLKKVVLPNTLSVLDSSLFYNCSALEEIEIPNTITKINSSVFYGCTSLKYNVYDGCKYLGNSTNPYLILVECNSGVKTCTVHSDCVYILSGAFSKATALTSITLPFIGGSRTTNCFFGYIFGASSYSYNSSYVPSTLKTVILNGNTTNIPNYAFYNCSSIQNITLPDTINTIGNYAFYGCSSLLGINLNACESIGSYAFYNCTAMTGIDIPDSVTSIGSYAFSKCAGLTEVELSENLSLIPASCFSSCTSLSSIEIPSKITKIDTNAFYNCTNLKMVTLVFGIEYIGDYAFQDCALLEHIVIPMSVSFIGRDAFDGCTSITYQEFGNGLYLGNADNPYYTLIKAKDTTITSCSINEKTIMISARAFYGCTSLSEIVFNENLLYIGDYAFYNCSSLSKIDVPIGVEHIGRYAFYGCSTLTELGVPFVGESISTNSYFRYWFGGSSYSDTNYTSIPSTLKTVTIYDGYDIIPVGAFYNCSYITTINLPSTIVKISDSAFYGCSSLINLQIPKSVNEIGASVFYNCNKLNYNEYGNALYLGNENNPYKVLVKAKNTNIETCSVHEDTEFVYASAFSNCASLSSITLNEKATIGDSVFYKCDNLMGTLYGNAYYLGTVDNPYLVLYKAKDTNIESCIVHPDARVIYYQAFYNCKALTTVSMGNNITQIGGYAFYGCELLQNITLSSYLKIIGSYAFGNCVALETFTIPSSVSTIGSYAFRGCKKLTNVVLSLSMTSISQGMFYECTSLKYISIPNNITRIEAYAFESCSNLFSIELPNSIIFIGTDAFRSCSRLYEVINYSSLTIAKGTTDNGYIGYYALIIHSDVSKINTIGDYSVLEINGELLIVDYLGNEKELVLPDSLLGKKYSIAKYAFRNCNSLEKVIISDSIINIGDYAFASCVNLKEVLLPSFTTISYGMFSGCTNLTTINFPETLKTIGSYAFSNCDSLITIYLPKSVQTIESSAFSSCDNLRTVCINSDISFGSYAFDGCIRLVEIINNSSLSLTKGSSSYGYIAYRALSIHKGSSTIVAQGDYMFVTDGDTNYLINYIGSDSEITLPSNYNGNAYDIGNWCFYKNTTLKKVTIPDCVKAIGQYAFYYCSNLTEVIIPSSVTTISSYAFAYCSSLQTITIPSSVTTLSSNAFESCYRLVEIVNNSAISITKGSGNGYYALSIHGGTSQIEIVDDFMFLTVEDANYLIGYKGNSEILELPNSYNGKAYIVWKYAFSGCSTIKSVVISEGVISIQNRAFNECENLESFTISTSVTRLEQYTLLYCYNLKTITFNGTKAEFNSISKAEDWNYITGTSVVHCSDGNVTTKY